ncbi:hypothetical protein TSIB_0794 [Thermococcus sibiricus MM 739]|uniref:Uncharacterized protein n=1 Tax=Thermococcus sibiricus (strain DSM 12597 / MM 739) TaxID=604354 RepID=C6A2L0_THESM|nr:hypothetical protein TSIB_0794 [Thermococcus sibiricus MM 739]
MECAEVLRNPYIYARHITPTPPIFERDVLENLFEINFFDEIVHAHDVSKTIHINADFKDVEILKVEVSLSKEKGTRRLTGSHSSNRDLKMELSRILHILKTNRRVGRRLGEFWQIHPLLIHQILMQFFIMLVIVQNSRKILESFVSFIQNMVSKISDGCQQKHKASTKLLQRLREELT